MIRTTRVCAGEYVVSNGTKRVRVTKVQYPNDGVYWIAAAEWDAGQYTDPLFTKRDAVFNAIIMITGE